MTSRRMTGKMTDLLGVTRKIGVARLEELPRPPIFESRLDVDVRLRFLCYKCPPRQALRFRWGTTRPLLSSRLVFQ